MKPARQSLNSLVGILFPLYLSIEIFGRRFRALCIFFAFFGKNRSFFTFSRKWLKILLHISPIHQNWNEESRHRAAFRHLWRVADDEEQAFAIRLSVSAGFAMRLFEPSFLYT